MSDTQWSYGDRVVHTAKPEWGTGLITGVRQDRHNGQPCLSVTVRFERAGVKTLSTAFATLASAKDQSALQPDRHEDPFLAAMQQQQDPAELLESIPENCSDPFQSVEQRIQETAKLYRFSGSGGPLLDWAVSQTGLDDPLTRFSRHELERHFERFAVERDRHLASLVVQLRRAKSQNLQRVLGSLPPEAQHVLQRADRTR